MAHIQSKFVNTLNHVNRRVGAVVQGLDVRARPTPGDLGLEALSLEPEPSGTQSANGSSEHLVQPELTQSENDVARGPGLPNRKRSRIGGTPAESRTLRLAPVSLSN